MAFTDYDVESVTKSEADDEDNVPELDEKTEADVEIVPDLAKTAD